jgi:hypothetical protein
MKMRYKNLLNIASGTLMFVFLAFSASAQRPSTGGGGSGSSGGGSKPSGGGSSVSSARPSGGGSVGVRPSGGSVGVSRPANGGGGSYNAPRPNASAVRGPVYVDRAGNVIKSNGYAPRVGVVNPQRPAYSYNPGVGIAPSPRAGVIQRGATAGGGSYRTLPPVGYGGYWGNHGYNYHNRGYYSSYYLPRLGYRCNALPYGYFPFYYGDFQYFYADGLFYQYADDEYTVVEPPIGAEVKTLPDKAQSIVINGQQYYELDGVYYEPVTKDDGTVVYEVVGKDGELNTTNSVQDQQPQGPQMGDIVNQLPPDCRRIKVNGQRLYVSPDGIYYQEIVDANGNTTYKIVGLPSDEPDQSQSQ